MTRKHLSAREAPVQTRSRMISLCRSLLRQEGVRVPSGGAPSFAKRVRALELPAELRDAVEPLLKAHEQVDAQIDVVDKKVEQAVANDERVQRLTAVRSVGPVTALLMRAHGISMAGADNLSALTDCQTGEVYFVAAGGNDVGVRTTGPCCAWTED